MNIATANSSFVIPRWLWFLTSIGVIYGSLYPFHFTPEAVTVRQAITILLSDPQAALGAPNIFANIVLFVPYGLFGMLALTHLRPTRRDFLVLTSSALLAFGIQVIQIWFSGRSPTVVDGVINMAGVLLGMAIAILPPVHWTLGYLNSRVGQAYTLPLLLLLTWLAYRWFPMVPTLDVFLLKQELKPLLLQTEWRPFNFIHNLVAWLVFAALWRQCGFRESLLWLMIPGSLLVQMIMADNPVLLHNILAAVMAPLLWVLVKALVRQPEWVIALLLAGMLILQGLRPFEIAPSAFKWIPFAGFLSGSMMVNSASLLEKLFLYGSFVWLMLSVTRSRTLALLAPVALMTAIEIAQIWISGRVAEITDPILCLLIWWVAIKEYPTRPPEKRASALMPTELTVEESTRCV